MFAQVPLAQCPHCGVSLCAASTPPDAPEPRAPQPGDVGLCTTCSGTLIYDEELMPRAPNEEELRELDQHEEMASLRKYLANYQAWKRSRLN